MDRLVRRLLPVAAPVLALGLLAGCSSKGATTECSTSACTITYERGVDAEATILGVRTELVGVEGNRARLRVAGQTVLVPAGGQAQAGGFAVTVREVTGEQVVVRVAQGGGG